MRIFITGGTGFIGTKLIKKAIKLAKERKVDSIELVVNKNNKIAKKLYEQAGFKKTKKDYFRTLLSQILLLLILI